MRAFVLEIVVVLAVGSAVTSAARQPAPASPHARGEVPRHMVAFVMGDDCPPGWEVDTLTPGRVIVGTDQMTAVGRVVGVALLPEEDRSHTHGVAGSTVSLAYKSISAADGGNNQGAAAGAQPVNGSITPASSGLPFVQLTACVSP
jgi:hypothetical protein